MNFSIEDVPSFYQGYIRQVSDLELIEALFVSKDRFFRIIENLSEEQSHYRYEEGKWSVKDIIQHLIDAEKVFCYRALRFCRGDHTPLEGFDQNDYVKEAMADKRPLSTLLEELQTVRNATIQFFTSLEPAWLDKKAVASGVEMSVEMIGYIIAGHVVNHLKVIQERYLK